MTPSREYRSTSVPRTCASAPLRTTESMSMRVRARTSTSGAAPTVGAAKVAARSPPQSDSPIGVQREVRRDMRRVPSVRRLRDRELAGPAAAQGRRERDGQVMTGRVALAVPLEEALVGLGIDDDGHDLEELVHVARRPEDDEGPPRAAAIGMDLP